MVCARASTGDGDDGACVLVLVKVMETMGARICARASTGDGDDGRVRVCSCW